MLTTALERKLIKTLKDTKTRNKAICPYCKKEVYPSGDAEYMKNTRKEFFFHGSCLKNSEGV